MLTTTLRKYKDFWPAGRGDSRSIGLRDLDGDGEPEVLLELFSGGANCCLSTLIYRYRANANTYVARPGRARPLRLQPARPGPQGPRWRS